MADPVLHIKDSYFFEVPKFLWRPNYHSLEDVPQYLRTAHPGESLAAFEEAMAGKILIPQFPGTKLKNLYEKESGFALSKFMVLEVVIALLLIAVFTSVARKISTGDAPRGRMWNLLESFLVFIRDQVARPAIGGHDADKFVPILWTMFFFILTCNLFGLIPWLGAPTSSFGTTFAIALVTFLVVLIGGSIKFGPIGFWKNQVPHMDLPKWLMPLVLVIFVIEVAGLLIKHGVLSVRLLANMVAGHLVLLGIMDLIVKSADSSTLQWAIVTTIAVIGSLLFTLLELFVAFLQAYVFTFLSALFIGAAVHHH